MLEQKHDAKDQSKPAHYHVQAPSLRPERLNDGHVPKQVTGQTGSNAADRRSQETGRKQEASQETGRQAGRQAGSQETGKQAGRQRHGVFVCCLASPTRAAVLLVAS